MTDRNPLQAAIDALGEGDELAALGFLRDSWEATRSAEIAELVETLSERLAPLVPRPDGKLEVFQAEWLARAARKRLTDLPVLLDTMLHTTQRSGVAIVDALARRGGALASWAADPRLGRGVARLITSDHFGAMAKSHQPFWRALFEQIARNGDPRSNDDFGAIRMKAMFRGWGDVATRIDFFDTIIGELRPRLPKAPPPLQGTAAKDVATLRKKLAALPAVAPALAARLGEAPRTASTAAAAARPARRGAIEPALTHLERARNALANHDDATTLVALLAAWNAARAPVIAAFVDAVSRRLAVRLPPLAGKTRAEAQRAWLAVAAERAPADVPRLVASLTDTRQRATEAHERLRALADHPPDPRIASGLIAHLGDIPFHSSSTRSFWSALVAFIVPHADASTAAALDELAGRFDRILVAEYTDLTATRTWFAKRVTAAANDIRDALRETPALDTETLALIERVATQLQSARPADEMLRQIFEAPNDDAPRQVYADYLLEQGDPRGELIALQTSGRVLVREGELVARHAATWLAPLRPIAWTEGTHFERGFPIAITLNDPRNQDALRRVVGHPLWRTVRRLELGPGFALPTELLQHPVLASLEHLGAYDIAPILELLAWKRVPYSSLGLDSEFSRCAADQRAFLSGASTLKELREIELSGQCFEEPKSARWLVSSALGKRLTRISLTRRCASLADWISLVARTPKASFRFFHTRPHGGSLEVVRDRKGQLTIARARIGGYIDAKKIDPDSLSYAELAELLASLAPDALSKLEIVGRPPMESERERIVAACARLPRVTVVLPARE